MGVPTCSPKFAQLTVFVWGISGVEVSMLLYRKLKILQVFSIENILSKFVCTKFFLVTPGVLKRVQKSFGVDFLGGIFWHLEFFSKKKFFFKLFFVFDPNFLPLYPPYIIPLPTSLPPPPLTRLRSRQVWRSIRPIFRLRLQCFLSQTAGGPIYINS